MIGRVHLELDPNLIPPFPPTSCPLLLPGLTSENLPLGFRRDSRRSLHRHPVRQRAQCASTAPQQLQHNNTEKTRFRRIAGE